MEEAKQEESKSVKTEVEGERGRQEIKSRCLDRRSSDVFEDFSIISEMESVGPLGFRCACLPRSSLCLM